MARRNVKNVHKSSLDIRGMASGGHSRALGRLRPNRRPRASCAASQHSKSCLCVALRPNRAAMPMHFVDQFGDVLRLRELRNAVAEVEDVAGEDCRSCRARRALRCGSPPAAQTARDGSILPCSATDRPTFARARARFTVQSRPTASTPIAAISFEPQAAALRERDDRHSTPSCSRFSPATTCRDVVEREALIGAVGERAAPGVEDHHGLRAGFDLRVQVGDHRLRVDVENAVHQVRARVQPST